MIALAALLAVVATAAAPAAEDKIVEVRLERTACYGSCPVDEIILRSDGTATYIGKEHVTRLGSFQGRVDQKDFARLAELLDQQGYFALKEQYTTGISCGPSVITRVLRGRKHWIVMNYGDGGPARLWGMERAILYIADGIKWEKDGGK